MYPEKIGKWIWLLAAIVIQYQAGLLAQCAPNQVINPGFETVDPPCGPVPPGGLINGSFNLGCMTGWLSAWGTPSVCSNNPYEGNYYACLGANNEGFYQDVSLDQATLYCLSFYYRRLNSGSGTLDVYLANGLVNQPSTNSGNPPLTIQPGWQLLGSFPSTGSAWEYAEINSFMQFDPANSQLLFLDVPTGGLDVGIDDVVLSTFTTPDPNVMLDIACTEQNGGAFVFQGSIDPVPPGWEEAIWYWTFGDGQSATGQVVNHAYDDYGTYEICLSFLLHCGCEFTTCIDFNYTPCLCDCGPDTSPPEFIGFNPAPIMVTCAEDIPPPLPPTVVDCEVPPLLFFEEVSIGPPCDRMIHYIWTAVDLCGNLAIDTQTIIYQDLSPPVFTDLPTDEVTTCVLGESEFLLWIQGNGGAQAMNDCDEPAFFSVDYDPLPETGCGQTIVTFTASDGCDNEATATASFTITDLAPPEWVVMPEHLAFPCSGPDITAIQDWISQNGGGFITDNCGEVEVTHDFNGDLSADSIQVVFSASDECFNVSTASAYILLLPNSDTIDLQQTTCDPALAGVDTILNVMNQCSVWTITTHILLPSDTILTQLITCQSDQAGTDTLILQNQYGCDSLRITEYIYVPADTTHIIQFTCVANEAMMDTMVLMGSDGCDSVIITAVIFTGTQTVVLLDEVICGAGIDFSDTLVIQGSPCDTLSITTYRYFPPDTTYLTEVTCQPVDTGWIEEALTNVAGCDSIVLTQRIYTPPDTFLFTDTICFGTGWTEVLVFTDQNGCDSVIAIFQTIVLTPDTLVESIFTCDSAMVGLDTLISPGPICDTVVLTDTQWIPSWLTEETLVVCADLPPAPDTLQYKSSQGCDSIHVIRYSVNPMNAEVMIIGESCMDREDGQVMIVNVAGGFPPYRFSLNAGSFSTLSEWIGLPPGQYQVVVEDAAGCRDTLAGLMVEAGQDFMVDVGPDRQAELNSVIDIFAMASHPVSGWEWGATDALSCPLCAQTAVGPISQAQWVWVNALSEGGCSDSDSLWIELKEEDPEEERDMWYVPNVFSPNEDGVNDRFFVSGPPDRNAVYFMEVYDRWGNLLFEGRDQGVNDSQGGWDGSFHQKPMNPGVYLFIIRLTSEGLTYELQGDVTVVR